MKVGNLDFGQRGWLEALPLKAARPLPTRSCEAGAAAVSTKSSCKAYFSVILNSVKDLNSLKMREAARGSE